ncbi:MAG: hypothetical protein ACRAS9_02375 [Mycoplasma sp.]
MFENAEKLLNELNKLSSKENVEFVDDLNELSTRAYKNIHELSAIIFYFPECPYCQNAILALKKAEIIDKHPKTRFFFIDANKTDAWEKEGSEHFIKVVPTIFIHAKTKTLIYKEDTYLTIENIDKILTLNE